MEDIKTIIIPQLGTVLNIVSLMIGTTITKLITISQYLIMNQIMKLTFMITIMTHLITFGYVQLPIAMTLQYPLNAQMIVMTMIPIKTFTST